MPASKVNFLDIFDSILFYLRLLHRPPYWEIASSKNYSALVIQTLEESCTFVWLGSRHIPALVWRPALFNKETWLIIITLIRQKWVWSLLTSSNTSSPQCFPFFYDKITNFLSSVSDDSLSHFFFFIYLGVSSLFFLIDFFWKKYLNSLLQATRMIMTCHG